MKPDLPKGWRWLRKGEKLRPGDKFYTDVTCIVLYKDTAAVQLGFVAPRGGIYIRKRSAV